MPDRMPRAMPASKLHDRRHLYRWPDIAPFEMEKVPSVTTVLSGGIPKDALMYWAAKMVAERAVDDAEMVLDWVQREEYGAALDHLKKAPNSARDTKADMGTIVHSALEAYVSGVDNEESLDEALESRNKRLTARQLKHAHGYYTAGMNFMRDHTPRIQFTEAAIFSREHFYAGTADMVGAIDIPGVGTDVPAILDYKTGKAIYTEMGIQLTAYSRGDFIALDDGTEFELPPLNIRHGVLVRLMPSGKYQAGHFRLTDDVFSVFLAAKAVSQRDLALDASRGRDLEAPEAPAAKPKPKPRIRKKAE